MKVKKWHSTLLVSVLVMVMILTGCAGNNQKESPSAAESSASPVASASESAPTSNDQPVKLKIGMWDTKPDIDFWTEKSKEFTKLHPNVTVEVETIPDNSGQYMKVRLAANDLPDLFYLKPLHIPIYKDSMLPLDDLQATAGNLYPEKIDGVTIANPLVSFSEYVYYHPSIFEELNLQIPQTLDEFLIVMQKIKENGKYIPLAIGGKEDWTFYPISEFGPHILSGDPDYLANLANTPEPFGPGSTFDQVAQFLKKLSDEKLLGPDALGIGFDQATQLFQAKKAAMTPSGQWYYTTHMELTKTDEDLDAFALPWRATTGEPLQSMTLVDNFLGVSKNSKHIDEAKAFYEWMFSPDVYQAYIDKLQNTSTVNGITSNTPFFKRVSEEHPFETFLYRATDERFAKVKSAAQYDEKKTAASIYAGADIAQIEKELNANWKKAVENVK